MSVVKLSVHKNNRLQREKKELRAMAVRDLKTCVAPRNVVGYCVVAWCEDQSANISWNITDKSTVRIRDIPPFMQELITRRITGEK